MEQAKVVLDASIISATIVYVPVKLVPAETVVDMLKGEAGHVVPVVVQTSISIPNKGSPEAPMISWEPVSMENDPATVK